MSQKKDAQVASEYKKRVESGQFYLAAAVVVAYANSRPAHDCIRTLTVDEMVSDAAEKALDAFAYDEVALIKGELGGYLWDRTMRRIQDEAPTAVGRVTRLREDVDEWDEPTRPFRMSTL